MTIYLRVRDWVIVKPYGLRGQVKEVKHVRGSKPLNQEVYRYGVWIPSKRTFIRVPIERLDYDLNPPAPRVRRNRDPRHTH